MSGEWLPRGMQPPDDGPERWYVGENKPGGKGEWITVEPDKYGTLMLDCPRCHITGAVIVEDPAHEIAGLCDHCHQWIEFEPTNPTLKELGWKDALFVAACFGIAIAPVLLRRWLARN